MQKKKVSTKSPVAPVKKRVAAKSTGYEKDRKVSRATAASLRKTAANVYLQNTEVQEDLKKTKSELDKLVAASKKKLDSMSEMGEMESLRLQMAMDRLSKMMSTLSNILKKISDTASSITQNIK